MKTPLASSISDQQVEEVLATFVELVSAWSSPRVQGQIAHQTGLDINEGDVRTLHTLGRIGGRVRPAQLALDLHLSRPTMSKSLARLLAAGLVERTVVAGDRRATDISLTPAGAHAYQSLIDAGTEMVRDALRLAPGIDTDSIVQFTRALGATL